MTAGEVKPPPATAAAAPADSDRLKQPPPGSAATFFALTFAVAWALWLLAAAVPGWTSLGVGTRAILFLPGTFAPALVALGLSASAHGRAGMRALLSRVLIWQVPTRWYLFAAGYMVAVKLMAALAYRVIAAAWPAFDLMPLLLLVPAVVMSTPFQIGEELGWRGYALPRLASRIGLAAASLVLGVVWSLWHLPLFFLPATDLTGQPFPAFLLSVTALSVAMAWLYTRTGGSLLLVMLMHSAVNNTTGIVPASVPGGTDPLALTATPVGWLTTAVLWVGAAYFLTRMTRSRSRRGNERPGTGALSI